MPCRYHFIGDRVLVCVFEGHYTLEDTLANFQAGLDDPQAAGGTPVIIDIAPVNAVPPAADSNRATTAPAATMKSPITRILLSVTAATIVLSPEPAAEISANCSSEEPCGGTGYAAGAFVQIATNFVPAADRSTEAAVSVPSATVKSVTSRPR